MTSKEAFEKMVELCNHYHHTIVKDTDIQTIYGYPIDNIKKDLEVLEILKKKEVAIDELKNCIKHDSKDRPALEEYNDFAGDENSLAQEEYDLLKEWLENGI